MQSEGNLPVNNTIYALNIINGLNGNLTFRSKTTAPIDEGFDYVLTDANAINQSSYDFSNGALSFEIARFVWLWMQIASTLFAIALCVSGYVRIKKVGLLIAGNIILFFLFCVSLIHLAYIASELTITMDMCEQIYNIVHNNDLPYNNTNGFATYLPPFSYVNLY